MRKVLALLFAAIAALGAGCADENAPEITQAQRTQPAVGAGAPDASAIATDASTADATAEPSNEPSAEPMPPPGTCRQARADSIPMRLRVMSSEAGAPPAPTGVTVDLTQMLSQFQSACTPCHTGNGFGTLGNILSTTDFAMKMSPMVLGEIMSEGTPGSPNPMPPLTSMTGRPFSSRSAGDPVVLLANEVKAWLNAGKPTSFILSEGDAGAPGAGGPDGGTGGGYLLTSANVNAMTNIGICVPSKDLVGSDLSRARQLDAMFAAAQKGAQNNDVSIDQQLGLPFHLSDTDLFTLDSRALAETGVIAYAPAYPLWSDNAKKIRHIRVPVGTSVHFDKATQRFEIPPNTRFYKTFLKPVIELDNSIRYKKVETRLIVARPNSADDQDTDTPPALFGTYLWNEAETDAVLGGTGGVQGNLHSGAAFADYVFEYVNDEPLAADLLQAQPSDPEGTLARGGAARHYAVPSSDRCNECHRGSPSRDFVLGFNPLQIQRRPVNTGGVIESAGPDELTQLQRFIDYGLITGIGSLSDVLPLELSEGDRKPRNPEGLVNPPELVAQGYMVGNCAHCHNPHGDPSVENPSIKYILNFLPSANGGGIFQFPLERFSPRIQRGNSTVHNIPYITPSLLDQPDLDPPPGSPRVGQTVDPFVQVSFPPDNLGVADYTTAHAIYAPWRSLIYRNVDNAFAYTDDVALYPHMPRNTPGYDPRLKQIMADWMVSIPAVRKHPELGEYQLMQVPTAYGQNLAWKDVEEQPYVEVLPGAPGYDAARLAAQNRLQIMHTGINPAFPLAPGSPPYQRLLDPGDTSDILDPEVLYNSCNLIPTHQADPNDPYPFALHPHWVTTDLTDFPGAWTPRRNDWENILVKQVPDTAQDSCSNLGGTADARKDENGVIQTFQNDKTAVLDCPLGSVGQACTSLRQFATTPLPYGLWDRKPGCDFSTQRTVNSFQCAGGAAADGGACDRPAWMIRSDELDSIDLDPDLRNPGTGSGLRGLSAAELAADAPVYFETPGAAVFKMICINCHGPLADSNGRMAQNLATMTGGNSRVANFRHGLLGPEPDPGANIKSVFGPQPNVQPPDVWAAPWSKLGPEDVAARYMVWMALGGTTAKIPQDIISLVGTTTVFGVHRGVALVGSANMLSNAKQICLTLVGPRDADLGPNNISVPFDTRPGHGYSDVNNASLIRKNGDAEMWLRLCTFHNHPFVHVVEGSTFRAVEKGNDFENYQLIPWDSYSAPGASVAVGNEKGEVESNLSETNLWPWCVSPGSKPTNVCSPSNPPPNCTPMCPAGLDNPLTATHPSPDQLDQWALRGAINAGFSVFLYLESLAKNGGPDPDYTECDKLPATASTSGK